MTMPLNTEGVASTSTAAKSSPFHFDVRQVPTRKPAPLNHVEKFAQAIVNAGLLPPAEIHDDGKLHRFSSAGKAEKNGWYVLHSDGVPTGVFGCWQQGSSHKWCAKLENQMTAFEKYAYQKRISESLRLHEDELAEVRSKAAAVAKTRWDSAITPVTNEYLTAKGVGAHGIRFDGSVLLIPMHDTSGRLHSLQFIDRNGSKRFLSGGLKKGCFHTIGHPKDSLIVCEGYATAASIFEATGQAVVVAFDAGNLEPVARAIRASNSHVKIVIAADDDWKNPAVNVGKVRALAAAEAVGGSVVYPVFSGSRGDKNTDFNDLASLEGLQAVRNCFEVVKSSLGTSDLAGFPILAMPEGLQVTEFVIDGFLPIGLTVIAGEPGVGKTTNLVPMAASAARLTPSDWGVHPKRRRVAVLLNVIQN